MPILSLRGMILFPGMIVPLFVGREQLKRAIEAAAASDMRLLCIAQKTDEDAPTSEGLFGVGTVARLLQRSELPDGTAKVLLECVERAAVLNYTGQSEYHEADIVVIENPAPPTQRRFFVTISDARCREPSRRPRSA
jgi:ATP-dependent Lon protease